MTVQASLVVILIGAAIAALFSSVIGLVVASIGVVGLILALTTCTVRTTV